MGRIEDINSIAHVCAKAFGTPFGAVADEVPALKELEERYAASIERELSTKLGEMFALKLKAQQEHAVFRRGKEVQALRAELARARGEFVPSVTVMQTMAERRDVARWRRSRMVAALVACDEADGGRVVGCVMMSLNTPEAALPPPFPTSARWRAYITNMAVLPSHQRRGVARALLRQCDRLAKRWCHTDVFLHVGGANVSAARLYRSMGFQLENEGLTILGPLRQVLLRKSLDPPGRWSEVYRGARSRAMGSSSSSSGGGSSSDGSSADDGAASQQEGPSDVGGAPNQDGVFVWNALQERPTVGMVQEDGPAAAAAAENGRAANGARR